MKWIRRRLVEAAGRFSKGTESTEDDDFTYEAMKTKYNERWNTQSSNWDSWETCQCALPHKGRLRISQSLLETAWNYSELLWVAWSSALHPDRCLLLFTRSYSELLGVTRSYAPESLEAPRCTSYTGTYSYLLGVTWNMLSVAPP